MFHRSLQINFRRSSETRSECFSTSLCEETCDSSVPSEAWKREERKKENSNFVSRRMHERLNGRAAVSGIERERKMLINDDDNVDQHLRGVPFNFFVNKYDS